jgi:drug/metabolite transporter (DMT)-like permease
VVQLIARNHLVVAFAAVYVLWGSTYLAVALGLQSIPPFVLMGARSTIAGVVLVALERFRRPGLPGAAAWAAAAAGGILLFVGCHGTLAYAQQHVPSGVAAVVLATIPFWMVLLNTVVPDDDRRPSLWAFIALVPGLAGVALVAWRGGGSHESSVDPKMVLLLAGSAFSWAAGSLISQRQGASTPPIVLSGMQLVCGGVVLLILGALTGELRHFSPAHVGIVSWAALIYLTLAGSIVGFTAYVWLLDHAPGPLVATYTFVNPIIAVVLGWAVLGERLSVQMFVGAVLVIGSVAALWFLEPSAPRTTKIALRDQPRT